MDSSERCRWDDGVPLRRFQPASLRCDFPTPGLRATTTSILDEGVDAARINGLISHVIPRAAECLQAAKWSPTLRDEIPEGWGRSSLRIGNYFRLMVAFSGRSCDEPPTMMV